MRGIFVVVAALLAPALAGAQIIRPRIPTQEPSLWVSFGAGTEEGRSVVDGATNSTWEIGSSTPVFVAVEKPIGSGNTLLGVAASTANVGLFFQSPTQGGADADGSLSQVFVTLRTGSGRDLRSMLEIGVGASVYSDFRARTTGASIGPASPDADLGFYFGYGLGYNFTPRFSVDLSQRVLTSIHQKTGLSPSSDSNIRVSGINVMGRIGIGGK